MTNTYISITPSDERFDPGAVVDIIRGLQEIHDTNDSTGVLSSVKEKITGKSHPTFEFIALSWGADDPIEFLYGVAEEHRTSLKHRLRELYPESFQIDERTLDPGKAIVPPVEMDVENFLKASTDDALWEDLTLTDEYRSASSGSPDLSNTPLGEAPSAGVIAGILDGDDQLGLPRSIPCDQGPTAIDYPAVTHDSTILARPSLDHITPRGLRWHGVGERKEDWMCQLRSFSEVAAADMDRRLREEPYNRRLPLASLIDRLGEFDGPAAFQVVFEYRPNFQGTADGRIKDLRRQSDTLVESLIGGYEEKSMEELGGRYTNRIEEIEEKQPHHCFRTTARLVTASVEDCPYGEPTTSVPRDLGPFKGTLSDLSGEFYHVDARRFIEEGWRQSTKEANARKAFERFQEGSVYRDGGGKSQPHLVTNADELASFITVPSREELSTEAARSVRSESTERTPLARPDPDELSHFREGMEIGYALDTNGEPDDEPLAIPPDRLTQHWARFAGTGSGKTIATQTDGITLHEGTEGPTVVVNRKGDNFAREFSQALYARRGHLDDVYYLRVPDLLPSMPLFDLRPALAEGTDRQTAIQEVKDHFRELTRLVMGRKQFNQASVANELLGHLIEAKFDRKHGDDAFTLNDLLDAAEELYKHRKIPDTIYEKDGLERLLDRHREKDDLQFARTMDGVNNRLSQLHEQAHLREILNTVPEWDYTNACYTRGLDFRDLVDEDVVILLDLGDLSGDSQTAITYLLLRNLWHGVKPRRRRSKTSDDLPQVNVIIEEAARIASTDLVYENFLPAGRGYGVALGLIMQFPQQVIDADEDPQKGKRAYKEVLNNVHTKLIGHIEIQEDLAKTLTTGEVEDVEEIRRRLTRLPPGEWVASLPQTEFGDTVPATFSLKSMEIPPGHPEGSQPLKGEEREAFFEQFRECSERAAARFDVESVEWYNRDGQYRRHTQPQAAGEGEVHGPESTKVSGFQGDPSGRPQRENPYANPPSDEGQRRDPASPDGVSGSSRNQVYPGAPGPDSTDTPKSDKSQTGATGGQSPTDSGEDNAGSDVHEVPPDDSPPGGLQDRPDGPGTDPDGTPGEGSGAEPATVSKGPRDPQAMAGKDIESSEPVEKGTFQETVENRVRATDEQPVESYAESSGDQPGDSGSPTEDGEQTPFEVVSRKPSETVSTERSADGGKAQFSIDGGTQEDLMSGIQSSNGADSRADSESEVIEQPDSGSGSSGAMLRAEQKALLEDLLLAMNREHPEYSLVEEGMKEIADRYDVDIDELIEDGYLEKDYVVRRTYYTVTPKGREAIGKTLSVGDGEGDLGEKTPHIVGVVLVKRMLEALDFDRVEIYYRHNGTVYDVAAFEGNSLVWVGEVERESNNPDAIVEDYEKLASVDAKAAWIFPTKSVIETVVEVLHEAGKIDPIDGRDLLSMDNFRKALKEQDAAGMDTAKTYDELIE